MIETYSIQDLRNTYEELRTHVEQLGGFFDVAAGREELNVLRIRHPHQTFGTTSGGAEAAAKRTVLEKKIQRQEQFESQSRRRRRAL